MAAAAFAIRHSARRYHLSSRSMPLQVSRSAIGEVVARIGLNDLPAQEFYEGREGPGPEEPDARMTCSKVKPDTKETEMIPDWVHLVSILSLAAGFLSAAIVAMDEWRAAKRCPTRPAPPFPQ